MSISERIQICALGSRPGIRLQLRRRSTRLVTAFTRSHERYPDTAMSTVKYDS